MFKLMNRNQRKKLNQIKRDMSLSDKLAYRELTSITLRLQLLFAPIYLIVYAGIFGLVLKYAWGLDILGNLKILLPLVPMFLKLAIILILIEIGYDLYNKNKINWEILNKKR